MKRRPQASRDEFGSSAARLRVTLVTRFHATSASSIALSQKAVRLNEKMADRLACAVLPMAYSASPLMPALPVGLTSISGALTSGALRRKDTSPDRLKSATSVLKLMP